MYSVLEDNGLTDANNLRSLSLEKLALLSTVCGCGIDMVPVPGTMFAEDLTGLVLDIATLAVRLKKPLGLRVLPVPNKAVNEYTELNLDFLCDSRVMDPGISASKPMLARRAVALRRRTHLTLQESPPCSTPSKSASSGKAAPPRWARWPSSPSPTWSRTRRTCSARSTTKPPRSSAWLPPLAGQRVLDLGAGVGQWTFRFAERGAGASGGGGICARAGGHRPGRSAAPGHGPGAVRRKRGRGLRQRHALRPGVHLGPVRLPERRPGRAPAAAPARAGAPRRHPAAARRHRRGRPPRDQRPPFRPPGPELLGHLPHPRAVPGPDGRAGLRRSARREHVPRRATR